MFGQQPLANHVVQRFKGQIRIDRPRAVTNEQREMMHFARFAGFQNQADPRARAFANQMMMHAGHRQQAPEWAPFPGPRRDRTKSKYWRRPRPRAVAPAAQILHRLGQARLAAAGLEKNGQRDGFEAGLVDVFELGKFLVGQDRAISTRSDCNWPVWA